MKRKWQPVVLLVVIVGLAWNGSSLREWVVPRDDTPLQTTSMKSARRSVAATEELVAQLAAQLATNQEQRQPAGQYVPLQSGWDASAMKLYSTRKASLVEAVTSNPNSVHKHTVLPLEPVRTTDGWFSGRHWDGSGPGDWEHQTFVNFFTYLSGCRYYVGFGTWIGPTMFFAAQLVDEAFGIEADPVAFASVETNLALNTHRPWARHVHLNHHAVGVGSSTEIEAKPLDMASASAGNSCSGVGATVSCGKAKVFWKVNSYTLPALLRYWGVPVTRELFIKIDVEMFECQLIPSWLPWITSLSEKGSKPVFHIAFHEQIQACSEQEYRDVYTFAKFFDSGNETCMDHDGQKWTCGTGEFVFHDNY